VDNVIRMIYRGYDIYHKNDIGESLFTRAIQYKTEEIVIKLIGIDTNFIDEFNTWYCDLWHTKDVFYYNIIKYCIDKYDGYKREIIMVMNDASPTNALYQSFHTTYAVQLVDVICDFILLRM
jgi:hypothetical protein